MKRNPFIIFLASVGIFFLLFIVAGIVLLYVLFGEKPSIIKTDAIGVIKVEGIITRSESILKQIEEFKEERHVKAVIVRINSPGGVVGPAQEIYQSIQELKEKKRVVASLGALGASGAYYIACAADRIVANAGTLTGSIGVLMEFANLQKLYQWAKIDASVIKSGRYKDIGSPLRPMTADEENLLRGVVDDIYDQFRKVVLESRKIAADKIDAITDGRIFSGQQAKELGLIDEVGNFQKAVEVAKMLAKIKGEPELIYPPKEKKYFLRYLLGESLLESLEKLAARQNIASPLLYLMPAFH